MRGNTPQGTINAFSVPHARGLEIFLNNSYDSNLGRSSDECMAISMYKPTAQRQKLALIFSARKMHPFQVTESDVEH